MRRGLAFPPVQQSVSLITLGVTDYAAAKAFYAPLGWSPALEVQETASFPAGGVILTLWGREQLAPDLGVGDDGTRVRQHRARAQRRVP